MDRYYFFQCKECGVEAEPVKDGGGYFLGYRCPTEQCLYYDTPFAAITAIAILIDEYDGFPQPRRAELLRAMSTAGMLLGDDLKKSMELYPFQFLSRPG